MRLVCVEYPRRAGAARAILPVLLAFVLAIVMAVPDAEARRKRRKAYVPYNPPYASMVYDVKSGRTLEATHADALRHPASITKVMTLYMLFEQLDAGRIRLNTELPVSREAASQAPSKLGLRPGDTIAVEDAIKALVTKSANDVAVVVAEALGGDEDRFARMMTAKARAIGMRRTTFYNASGLPHPRQFTTARDLVTLGRVIQDRFPRYYAYFGTRAFEYDGRAHRNHNRLLGQVEGVDGIKTGYTRASGFNLLTSARADGRHLITVVLGGRTGRARDLRVAELIENHMERAYAGRRLTAKTTAVAARDEGDDDEETGGNAKRAPARDLPPPRNPQQLAAVLPPPPVPAPVTLMPRQATPLPPSRPRPAVIAETGPRAQGNDLPAPRARSLALSANGSTNAVRGTTSPMALVATTPASPAMRWVPGPAGVARPGAAEGRAVDPNRLVPPGNVRYTNTTSPEAPRPEETQPLPAPNAPPSPKVEDRLPGIATRAQAATGTSSPAPEPVRPVEAAKTPANATPTLATPPTPARTGWIIQLAAADSDAKARAILSGAAEKVGLLRRAEPFTEPVAKGGATLYRARFAGFNAESAQDACKALKRAGVNCFAQKL